MPYFIQWEPWQPKGKRYALRKVGSAKLMGRHPSKEAAQRQREAIYANTEGESE